MRYREVWLSFWSHLKNTRHTASVAAFMQQRRRIPNLLINKATAAQVSLLRRALASLSPRRHRRHSISRKSISNDHIHPAESSRELVAFHRIDAIIFNLSFRD